MISPSARSLSASGEFWAERPNEAAAMDRWPSMGASRGWIIKSAPVDSFMLPLAPTWSKCPWVFRRYVYRKLGICQCEKYFIRFITRIDYNRFSRVITSNNKAVRHNRSDGQFFNNQINLLFFTPKFLLSVFCLFNQFKDTGHLVFGFLVHKFLKIFRGKGFFQIGFYVENFPPAVNHLPAGKVAVAAFHAIGEVNQTAQSGTASFFVFNFRFHRKITEREPR